jgi:hypothetical protein
MTIHNFNPTPPKKGSRAKKKQEQPTSSALNFDAVNQLAEEHIEQILRSLAPEGDLQGKEYRMLNPRRPEDSNLGSFKFNIETGSWADFAAEGAAGGDIVSLVAYMRNEIQTKAAHWVKAFVEALQKSSTTKAPKASEKTPKNKDDEDHGQEILPIPPSAEEPPSIHPGLGAPDRIYSYVDAEGSFAYSMSGTSTRRYCWNK